MAANKSGMTFNTKDFDIKFAKVVNKQIPEAGARMAYRVASMVIRDAMQADDKHTIGNRQLRLLNAGFEIPITLQQCNRLLEKYKDGS